MPDQNSQYAIKNSTDTLITSTVFKVGIFLFLIYCFFLINAVAGSRVALIIGNADYQSAPLTNPVNDAEDMARALQGLDFEVLKRTNVDRKGMRQVLREFGEKLKHAEVGLFYFAGHGIQIKGKNYLIPVNSNVVSADEVEDESIAADAVLRKMETAGNDVNIVILDACRNNPFARSFRSMDNGLARMEGPVGSYIAYATAPGSIASDGMGRNGLYTQYLLQALKQPELTIEQTFKFVRNGVRADTDGKQTPWESSSLTGEFSFSTNKTPLSIAAINPSIPPPPPISSLGHLQVVTNVSNAKVSINNQQRGLVDNQGILNISNVSDKRVEILVTADGYQQQHQKVDLEPGQWKTITIHLQPVNIQNKKFDPQIYQADSISAESASCFKNKRVLLRNQLTIQTNGSELQQKSHAPELNAIITKALNKYQVKVIDADDITSKQSRTNETLSQINEFIKTAKKYNAEYVLATDVNVSETPITTIKTKMKSMHGDITLRVYDINTAQVLASNTRAFTKAGMKIRPIIKKVMHKQINSSVQKLIFESCAKVKTQPRAKPNLIRRAKNLFNF